MHTDAPKEIYLLHSLFIFVIDFDWFDPNSNNLKNHKKSETIGKKPIYAKQSSAGFCF